MILIHRCTTCGHNDLEARAHPSNGGKSAAQLTGAACANGCSCKRHVYGPPEVAPSFTDGGRPIERIATPGSVLTISLTTCSCEDCKAEHERLQAS